MLLPSEDNSRCLRDSETTWDPAPLFGKSSLTPFISLTNSVITKMDTQFVSIHSSSHPPIWCLLSTYSSLPPLTPRPLPQFTWQNSFNPHPRDLTPGTPSAPPTGLQAPFSTLLWGFRLSSLRPVRMVLVAGSTTRLNFMRAASVFNPLSPVLVTAQN